MHINHIKYTIITGGKTIASVHSKDVVDLRLPIPLGKHDNVLRMRLLLNEYLRPMPGLEWVEDNPDCELKPEDSLTLARFILRNGATTQYNTSPDGGTYIISTLGGDSLIISFDCKEP